MADTSRGRSLTHDHLLAVVNTELFRNAMFGKEVIRILDVGCGSGKLMLTLKQNLSSLHPGVRFDIYGLEVIDYMGAGEERKARIVHGLSDEDPGGEWDDRVEMCLSGGVWPFADHSFDVVISNQVLEHVEHVEHFFSELSRVLAPGGVSAHLFPLGHCLWEDHIKVPIGPRILNYDLLVGVVRLSNIFGVGRYRTARRKQEVSLRDFANREADYIANYTHYKRQAEYLELGKKVHLRTSFRYTGGFYMAKLRTLVGLRPSLRYSLRTGIGQAVRVGLLRYISSVTLFLENKNTRRE